MRSAIRATSQLPGRGPIVVDMAHINQKSDDDDDDYWNCLVEMVPMRGHNICFC